MTTNQTPEAGSVAKLAEEIRSELRHFTDGGGMRAAAKFESALSRLAALAEQGQRDSERQRDALRSFLCEFGDKASSETVRKARAALNPEKTA